MRPRCPRMTQVRAAWSDMVKALCPELGDCTPSYRALPRARLLSARVWWLSWAAQVSRKEAPGHCRSQPLPHCLGCANSPPPTLPIPSPLFGPPGRNKLEVESRESYFKMYKAYCTHPSPPYPVACSDESLEKVYKSQEVYGRCVASGSRCG